MRQALEKVLTKKFAWKLLTWAWFLVSLYILVDFLLSRPWERPLDLDSLLLGVIAAGAFVLIGAWAHFGEHLTNKFKVGEARFGVQSNEQAKEVERNK